MSYSFDGKVANQCPRTRNFASAKTFCEKCNKLIDFPKTEFIKLNLKTFCTYNYLDKEFFIYETKGHHSIAYCSKYCRNKHNHRFNKR